MLVNRHFDIEKPPPRVPFQEHCCAYTRPSSQCWPLEGTDALTSFKSTKAIRHESERALLSWFLARFHTIDPDLIVVHDADDCQLDAIFDRVIALNIGQWSRMGRLRLSLAKGRQWRDFIIGRMLCDIKRSAEELLRMKSYDLDSMCTNVLHMKENERTELPPEALFEAYESVGGILKLITSTMEDCAYVLRIMCELNVLPLALQITTICGNLMGRTLQGGRSERNESLLLHAFVERDYIVPDKAVREWNKPDDFLVGDATPMTVARKKPQYSGGLVLEPLRGFYDKFILLMDFNSLYPSIIQEYNICFTTIPMTKAMSLDGAALPPLPDSTVEAGVLPTQIRRLVESRRAVKKLMANPDLDGDLKVQYNIRQMALKLTANSMYGCLGFKFSRFYAQHLAALVTQKGRDILMNTRSLVQKLNYEVIYGDTDSIMINTNCTDYEQVQKIGTTIKQTVNKAYRQVELEVDGVFKYLLLLRKKKYAAMIITRSNRGGGSGDFVYTEEHKGLDIVRRDWSQLAVMAGQVVLRELLQSDAMMEERVEKIHSHLERIGRNVAEGTVPDTMLTITKQLTKAPRDYGDASKQPHASVALRMNSTRNKRYKKGDMVSYVICLDGTNNSAMQRAYHLDELRAAVAAASIKNSTVTDDAAVANDKPKLTIDCDYYLKNQVHAVVTRLLEPIEGTDTSRIAVCLGLDASMFKVAAQK